MIKDFLVKIISTFFYVGRLPFMPGTFGSIAGLAIFFLTKGSGLLQVASSVACLVLGLMVSTRAERIFNKKDAPCIVIDEVCGMLLSLLFLPFDTRLAITGFVLFRIFDILKPYPAKKLQQLRGSIGIMSDDIVCALYVNVILQLIVRITSLRGS